MIESKYDEIFQALRLVKNTKGDMAFGNMRSLQAEAESVLRKYFEECKKHLTNIKLEINKKGGDELIPLRFKKK